MEISKVSKEFGKAFLPKLKDYNNQKISKDEKELETIKGDDKKAPAFSLGKAVIKVIETLNDKSNIEYFKKDEVPNEYIVLIYRIIYQIINKEKDMLKVKNNNEFCKSFKEHIIKNSEEKGIGEFLKNELSNLDLSPENVDIIYSLCEGKEEKLNAINKEGADKSIFFIIKNILEYIGISLGNAKNKKLPNNEVYQKYLEYIINKRKENVKKLDKIISKI